MTYIQSHVHKGVIQMGF